MRDTEQDRALETLRTFFASTSGTRRSFTGEWLAGRLLIRRDLCEAALSRLVANGSIRRQSRRGDTPIYEIATGTHRNLAARVLAVFFIVVVVGLILSWAFNSQYVLGFAGFLAVGLIIGFAWLDFEMRAQ